MIEVNQCSKKFGVLQAVNKVSFRSETERSLVWWKQWSREKHPTAYDGRDHTWG